MRTILVGAMAAMASGCLLVLALPLGEQAYLAWFALVPLLVATRGRGFVPGFLCGVIATFFAAWLSTTGVFYQHRDPNGSSAWVYTGFGIFGFSLAIAVGAWSDRSTLRLSPWWFASLAVLLEACLLFQLPAHLALTQYRQPVLAQVASIGGVWLVSFVVWFANFKLACLKPKPMAITALLLTGVSLASNGIHLSAGTSTARFAAIQVAEPDEGSLTRLQKEASKSKPALVVWPEFAGISMAPQGRADALKKLSVAPGSAPFITSFQDDAVPMPHNISALFSGGTESPRYAKRKLFGGEVKMHTPGEVAVAVPYARGAVGLNICFDSCYPSVIRDTANLPGVNVISLPSIDPFATNNFVAAIHASYSPFRAAEEGVAVVKCDGMAYSLMVDPMGQIVAEAPPGDQIVVADVPVTRRTTIYGLLGDWFLWLCGVLVVVGLWRERQLADKKLPSPDIANKE